LRRIAQRYSMGASPKHRECTMPTNKRRVVVCLPPELDKLLASISKAGRVSQAGVVLQILEAAAPTLERMARGFRDISQAVEEERAIRLAALDREAAIAAPAVDAAVAAYARLLDAMDAAGGAGRQTGAEGAVLAPSTAPISPRAVITGGTSLAEGGVGVPKKGQKRARKGAG
jgi:hypothetical protein